MARCYWDWNEAELHAGIVNVQSQLTALTGNDWAGVVLYVPEEVVEKSGSEGDDVEQDELEDQSKASGEADGTAAQGADELKGRSEASIEADSAATEGGNEDESVVSAMKDEGEGAGAEGQVIIINDFDTVDSMFEGEDGELDQDYERAKLEADIEKVKARLRRLGVVIWEDAMEKPRKAGRGRRPKGLYAKRWRDIDNEDEDEKPKKRKKKC